MTMQPGNRRTRSFYISLGETAELQRQLLEEPSDAALAAFTASIVRTDEQAKRFFADEPELECLRKQLASTCFDAVTQLYAKPEHQSRALTLLETLESQFADQLSCAQMFVGFRLLNNEMNNAAANPAMLTLAGAAVGKHTAAPPVENAPAEVAHAAARPISVPVEPTAPANGGAVPRHREPAAQPAGAAAPRQTAAVSKPTGQPVAAQPAAAPRPAPVQASAPQAARPAQAPTVRTAAAPAQPPADKQRRKHPLLWGMLVFAAIILLGFHFLRPDASPTAPSSAQGYSGASSAALPSAAPAMAGSSTGTPADKLPHFPKIPPASSKPVATATPISGKLPPTIPPVGEKRPSTEAPPPTEAPPTVNTYNGMVIVRPDYEGVCPFTVNADAEEDCYIYLKYLCSPADTEEPRKLKTMALSPYEEDVAMIVKAGQTASIHVPIGVYQIFYCTGTDFYGPELLFGTDSACYDFEKNFSFYQADGYYNGTTITLQKVAYGNLSSDPIKASEFPKP